jgi:hypothetical protein
MTPQQRAKAAQRVLVVAANSEVQEVGLLAFKIAFERWMEADNDEPFSLYAAAVLSDLQTGARPNSTPGPAFQPDGASGCGRVAANYGRSAFQGRGWRKWIGL